MFQPPWQILAITFMAMFYQIFENKDNYVPGRKGGDIGLEIILVPKVIIYQGFLIIDER